MTGQQIELRCFEVAVALQTEPHLCVCVCVCVCVCACACACVCVCVGETQEVDAHVCMCVSVHAIGPFQGHLQATSSEPQSGESRCNKYELIVVQGVVIYGVLLNLLSGGRTPHSPKPFQEMRLLETLAHLY